MSAQADLSQPSDSLTIAEALTVRLRYVYPAAVIRREASSIMLVLPNGKAFTVHVEAVDE